MLCEDPRMFPTYGGLLPCGQCRPCRINRRREKTTRLLLEAQSHDDNTWITLTYRDEHLPKNKIHDRLQVSFGSDCFPTLWRPDYQNFLKRLRRNVSIPFKFFLAGEYGEKFGRPHYHAFLFGLGDRHRGAIRSAWSIRDEFYKPQPIGNVFFGDVNWDTMQYTAGYTVKKMTSFRNLDLHGRYPEFGQGSKGLSLMAVEDITRYMLQHRLNDIPSYLLFDGKKIPVPRYLKSKLKLQLGISDEEARKEYDEEMLALRWRARNSKTCPSVSALYVEENRQSLLNQNKRLKLFFEKEKLL